MAFLSILRLSLYCILVSSGCCQAAFGRATVADDAIHTVGFLRRLTRPHSRENTLHGKSLPL